MDNKQFGAFLAQLRKEQNLTQKELATRLCVTDKAVSKWETGKGFPDIKLLDPLAQALGVTLVDLIQGERTQREYLTTVEADAVVSQAMENSQKMTARRYLRLLRWLLTCIGVCCAYQPVVLLGVWIFYQMYTSRLGIIGGADGVTGVIVFSSTPWAPIWVGPTILGVIALVCLWLVLRIRTLERALK